MKFVLIIFFLMYTTITCSMELINLQKEILSKIAACSEPCDRNNCMKVNKYLHDCFSIKNHAIVAHSPLKLGREDQTFFMLYYCDEGKEEIVKNLLHNGFSANLIFNPLNVSALSIALQNKHYKAVELLQQYGAESKKFSFISPLFMAAYKGDLIRVKWYCENKLYDDNSLKINGIPLLCIAATRHTNIVEFLLAHFESNPHKLFYKEDTIEDGGYLFCGRNVLHFAAVYGNVSSMQLLLNSDVISIDIDNKDRNGCTPLHYAVMAGELNAIQFLIEHRVNVNAQDNVESTPLHYSSNMQTAQYLLDNGAQINAKNSAGYIPLHYAVHSKKPIDLIILLLERGAQINALDINEQTPLHIAAIFKNNAAIKLLIARGAQKDIRDNKGKLAVEYAAEHPELDDCIELLSCESDAQQINTFSFFELTKK